MEEIWKDISGYEGFYQVSNMYRVKSLERIVNSGNGKRIEGSKIIKMRLNERGYYRLSLSKNGECKNFTLHRLIAKAFIPNPHNKPEINHINGIKTDNRIDNLEWVTTKENVIHAETIGLRNKNRANGEKNGASKLTEKQVIDIREKFKTNKYTKLSLAKEYNVGQTLIGYIISRKYWKHI